MENRPELPAKADTPLLKLYPQPQKRMTGKRKHH